jgi:hypothetical protein
MKTSKKVLIIVLVFTVFLIFILILAAYGSWIVNAAVHGATALFQGIASLFEFIFYPDGFFELFGPVGSCLVIGLVVVLIVLIVRKLLVIKV